MDDSLFSGPALNPAWADGDVAAGEVAPLYPLALNSARFDPAVTTGPRPQDSAITAAEAFAAQLTAAGAAAGLTVAAGVGRLHQCRRQLTVTRTVLAGVQSATVAEQVDLMLQTSDNYLAEVLGRMAAAASGQPASNDGATAAVKDQLAQAGIPTDTMRLADVSGLALDNQVSASQFAERGPCHDLRNGSEVACSPGRIPGGRSERNAGFPVQGRRHSPGRGAGARQDRDTEFCDRAQRLRGGRRRAPAGVFVHRQRTDPGAAGNREALDRAAAALAACGCR